jgi:hypothetical protein
MFGGRRRNLAEILVFTTYLAATTSLLWTALPLLDLAVPIDLARSEAWVAGIASVLAVGYFGLALLLGPEHAVSFAPLSVLTRHGMAWLARTA